MKTASEAFRRVRDLFTNYDHLRKLVDRVTLQRGDEGIELRNGARLRFVARSSGSGRGFSGDCVILDEAYALTDAQMEALMPTMSARPNPQIWYTSSPPLNGITGEQLFRVRRRGLAGGSRLAYFDFGIDGDLDSLSKINLDDRALWRISNPALGLRVSEEFVESERQAMSDEGFARERLGVWPAEPTEGYRLIPQAMWADALDPASEIDGRPAYGVYVPPDRSYAAIAASGARTDGGRHIEVTGNQARGDDHRPGTGWIVDRLLELERHDPSVLVIDDKAIADAAEAAGLTVHRAGVGDVVTGCQLFYDGIAGPDAAARDVHHLGQKALTEAVAGAVKRPVGGSWAWDRYKVTVDVAPLAAASLALFGHSTPRVHRDLPLVPLVAWR
jgi:hypothetical protein